MQVQCVQCIGPFKEKESVKCMEDDLSLQLSLGYLLHAPWDELNLQNKLSALYFDHPRR